MVLTIKTDSPYQVVIENGVLDRVGKIAAKNKRPGAKAMVVSETNVFPLYGERLKASLAAAGFLHLCFPLGSPQSRSQLFARFTRL